MARKVIPEDVREVFGKREAKRTWPAALSEPEAKAAYGEWLRETETHTFTMPPSLKVTGACADIRTTQEE